jgi:hypothetical protein
MMMMPLTAKRSSLRVVNPNPKPCTLNPKPQMMSLSSIISREPVCVVDLQSTTHSVTPCVHPLFAAGRACARVPQTRDLRVRMV